MRIIDVVEFLDDSGREIVHREPQGGPGDFRLGSQVIVRQSQVAVFFRDGRALDIFGPGRHTLATDNLPILSGLIGLATSGRTPFPAEVVFVNMRQFIDQKWGTPEPIAMRDPVFGMARLRSFGSYAFQVADPGRFVNGIVGQQGKFTTSAVQDYLRAMIVQRFTETLGLQQRSVIDLPSQYGELSTSVRSHLADDFASLGLALSGFYVNAISPTEETAKAIEERSAMGAVGNLDDYMKFKAARALSDAASNPGGGAGAGVGLGAGIGLGASMAGMLGQAFQPQQPQPQQAPPPPPPQAAAPAGSALTRAQVQDAIDTLDLRFSKGEIGEDAYNRLMAKWEAKLKELGG
ncbi:MAG TPA: SPFH domain-containing protein [Roseiflexaceae bacterium]